MELTDSQWSSLHGGNRTPYDPRPELKALKARENVESAWARLWGQLNHQGDVDEASYAALIEIAQLVIDRKVGDWNAFALAATIEEGRMDDRNPPVPQWLLADYSDAWSKLFSAGLAELSTATDDKLIRSILAVLSIHKGQPLLGRMALLSEENRKVILDEVGWA